jgi:hypothetical protein
MAEGESMLGFLKWIFMGFLFGAIACGALELYLWAKEEPVITWK